MVKDIKKAEKKKKIIETAYQLFKSAGVSSTAIDDVVKSAGIARGTFYLYFKDKSDLLEQLIFYKSAETVKQLLSESFQKIESENLSFMEGTGVFIDMYIDFLVLHKDVLTIVNKNISSGLRFLPDFSDADAAEMYNKIVDFFKKSGFDEKKAHKTIYIIVDLIGSTCCDAILTGKPFTLEEIRDEVKQAALCILRGSAVSAEGRKPISE